MKAVLLRTGSVPVHLHSLVSDSPRSFVPVHDSIASNGSASPRISMHLEANRRRHSTPARGIRRAFSESDVSRSESQTSGGLTRPRSVGSRFFPARIPEEECVSEGDEEVGGVASLILNDKGFESKNHGEEWPENGIPVEELGFPGGGIGRGRKTGGGDGDDWCAGTLTGGNADLNKIGAYYEEILKSNPTNSLLLRNYARFLHEVAGDVVKAEHYYGRAILASPGDGDVLSLYGKLIWETQRDEDRAESYFDRAVHASPDDCMVLGSYAHFMWEAEDEDEGADGDGEMVRKNDQSAAMVEAF